MVSISEISIANKRTQELVFTLLVFLTPLMLGFPYNMLLQLVGDFLFSKI